MGIMLTCIEWPLPCYPLPHSQHAESYKNVTPPLHEFGASRFKLGSAPFRSIESEIFEHAVKMRRDTDGASDG